MRYFNGMMWYPPPGGVGLFGGGFSGRSAQTMVTER